ncbi:DUF5686 family protein [Ferruginibacter paludis]|uniref:DUF5686 family protein n=1 Tax=Ferruginibacter paludis TaxID=1310417 RepID=UPI0025B4FD88|nr:DUF5686 family protein [Ferruginibacter paludis]MDN3657459.1 DUF5686 family protein [Ferruginibacter paludis]
MYRFILFLALLLVTQLGKAQDGLMITGRVTEAATGKAIQNATVHLTGSNNSTLTKIDGSFRLVNNDGYDSIEITCVGFEPVKLLVTKGQALNLVIEMKNSTGALQGIVIGNAKLPGKAFMQKVIDHKATNNPSKFTSYSYASYTRCELDIDQVDFKKAGGKGLKSLMLKTYNSIDTTAADDKELPIYFAERLANNYHSVSPHYDRENIIAKKNLGLKTDNLISKLDKFYFNFNVYDDWLPLFEQTYVSPLNTNAFNYYKFFEGDTLVENGDTIQQIRFTPLRAYERAFTGTLWINTHTLAVESINMYLSKTANINFVSDINYNETYQQVFDSSAGTLAYMPYKFSSEIKFESGLALLGIPGNEHKKGMKFLIKNTTVTDNIKLNAGDEDEFVSRLIKKEQTTDWDKPDAFWQQHRPDSLTRHEANIYKMVDSLKQNKRFERDIRLVAFAGTGYWDFGSSLRLGSLTSFFSKNSIEGMRFRVGFWTMPGISKKLNIFGYGAYGTKDQKLKGLLGVKYVWNAARWTKTSLSFGSDYDFIIDQPDEMDKDNIINSLLRKKIPFTRMYVKEFLVSHDQYLSPDFSVKGAVGYKELNPVFDFKYRPINPDIDKPYDSVFVKKLPVAEASFVIRYAHKERAAILNYDRIRLGTFYPVVTAGYTYGFELGSAQFEYHKLFASVEQKLRLPPKSLLFYRLDIGKVFGTIPYLLLNIPAGNEYYVTNRYIFNTMAPYEFAADRYVSLHSRFYLGGALLDKIPLLQKLGWRERFSFNAYWGDMTQSNMDYNKNSNFNLIRKTPFMEAGAGIGNIFHILSVEYYRRFNYLGIPYAKKGGVYLGLTLSF